MNLLLRSSFTRNIVIVALFAAALTAAGEGGSQVADILFLIVRVAFLVALAWLGWTVWRENRGTFRLMPVRSQLMLYGSVLGIVVLILSSGFWAGDSALAALVFFAALGGCCYLLYRGWQESRRYYY